MRRPQRCYPSLNGTARPFSANEGVRGVQREELVIGRGDSFEVPIISQPIFPLSASSGLPTRSAPLIRQFRSADVSETAYVLSRSRALLRRDRAGDYL